MCPFIVLFLGKILLICHVSTFACEDFPVLLLGISLVDQEAEDRVYVGFLVARNLVKLVLDEVTIGQEAKA